MSIEHGRFVKQKEPDGALLKYSAGRVCGLYGEGSSLAYSITEYQAGAEETFTVGQPVYDTDNNLLGYLKITLYEHLNYDGRFNGETIPVEEWQIGNPTEHCKPGKNIMTYWQRWAKTEKDGEE